MSAPLSPPGRSSANFCAVGYCLKNRTEQQGSLQFLSCVEKVLGWRTSWIKEELERQWAELGQVDSPDS